MPEEDLHQSAVAEERQDSYLLVLHQGLVHLITNGTVIQLYPLLLLDLLRYPFMETRFHLIEIRNEKKKPVFQPSLNDHNQQEEEEQIGVHR
jgi:hypothetical protein